MKITFYLLIFLVIILFAFISPALVDSVTDFKTKQITQEFIVTTPAGVTSTNVSLSNALWYGDISLAGVTSNITNENPVTSNYTTTNNRLEISGLDANASHLLTVVYSADALTRYPNASRAMNYWPVALVFALIAIPLILMLRGFRA